MRGEYTMSSESRDTKIRISPELYDQIKQLSEKSGKSMRELVEEAIRIYMLGTVGGENKQIKSTTSKIISLNYATKCRKCQRELKENELAYWVKITYDDNTSKSFIYCLDCYYSDTALAEYYVRKKKLESIIRGLEKKAQKLMEDVELLDVFNDLVKVEKEIIDYWNKLLELITHEDDRKKLDEALDTLSYLVEKVKQIENTFRLTRVYQRMEEKRRAKIAMKTR